MGKCYMQLLMASLLFVTKQQQCRAPVQGCDLGSDNTTTAGSHQHWITTTQTTQVYGIHLAYQLWEVADPPTLQEHIIVTTLLRLFSINLAQCSNQSSPAYCQKNNSYPQLLWVYSTELVTSLPCVLLAAVPLDS